MHKRTGMLVSLLAVVLLAAALMPLAQWMEESRDHILDETQKSVLQALLSYEAHLSEAPGAPVLPIIDIEQAWEIEDARMESETPLVLTMKNGGDELGYDKESRTFYCTLGLENEDVWPQIALTAKGEPGVQVAWIDDYTYDWRSDAVAEGYSYELIAYTDTAYEYIYIVFTGLPIVTLHTQEEIGDTYIPCRATVAGSGYEAIDSAALTHTRGGGFYKGIDKESYRLEFHGVSSSGKDKKTPVSVLGMPADTDWLLVSNAGDETCMRNELCFDLWRRWNMGEHTVMALDTRMIEVFVNDEYMGLYQLMPRVRADEEITNMGGSLSTDISARLIGERYETGKPLFNAHELIDGVLELRYAPQGMSAEKAFDRYQPYIAMNLPKENPDYCTDEEFVEIALEHVDIEETMSYYLFMQATTMTLDNVKNNLYVWAVDEGDTYRYRFSPWDMDSCIKPLFSDDTTMFNFLWPMASRSLDMNVYNARQVVRDLWEARKPMLSEDALYQWFDEKEEEINASGAYMRETEKWRGGARPLDLGALSAFMINHMSSVERILYDTWPLDVPAIEKTGE